MPPGAPRWQLVINHRRPVRRGPPSITKRKISFDTASRPAVGRNPFSVRPPVAEAFRPADDSRGRREDDDSTCQQAIVVALSQETLLSRVPRWRGGRYPMRNPQVGQVRLSFNSQSPVEFRGHTAQAITGTAWCHALTGTQLLKRLASIGVVTM